MALRCSAESSEAVYFWRNSKKTHTAWGMWFQLLGYGTLLSPYVVASGHDSCEKWIKVVAPQRCLLITFCRSMNWIYCWNGLIEFEVVSEGLRRLYREGVVGFTGKKSTRILKRIWNWMKTGTGYAIQRLDWFRNDTSVWSFTSFIGIVQLVGKWWKWRHCGWIDFTNGHYGHLECHYS